MGNKEEWDEIEKFVKEADNKKLEKYKGMDITKNLEKLNEKPKNNKDKEWDMLTVINVIVKIVLGIFTIWIFYSLFKLMLSGISNMLEH